MCQYVEPSYCFFVLSIQTTSLLVGKINVKGTLFCSSKLSLAVSFGCVLLVKVDSLKDCMKKIVLNRIRLIKVNYWPSYPLGHLRVEYVFSVIN